MSSASYNSSLVQDAAKAGQEVLKKQLEKLTKTSQSHKDIQAFAKGAYPQLVFTSGITQYVISDECPESTDSYKTHSQECDDQLGYGFVSTFGNRPAYCSPKQGRKDTCRTDVENMYDQQRDKESILTSLMTTNDMFDNKKMFDSSSKPAISETRELLLKIKNSGTMESKKNELKQGLKRVVMSAGKQSVYAESFCNKIMPLIAEATKAGLSGEPLDVSDGRFVEVKSKNILLPPIYMPRPIYNFVMDKSVSAFSRNAMREWFRVALDSMSKILSMDDDEVLKYDEFAPKKYQKKGKREIEKRLYSKSLGLTA
jgi:hypothetical protein